MKRLGLFIVVTATTMNFAQPREQQELAQPPTQELVECINHLQQTGQLTPPKQEAKDAKKEGDEEKKFIDAANGIFAGMLTIISGATSKDPVQIASGIFSMLGAAFLAATRNKAGDEEAPPLQKRSRKTMKALNSQDLKLLVARNQHTPFKKRS